MKNLILSSLISIFTITYANAENSKLKKLTCTPANQKAIIEVIFPKLIDAMNPFIGFPEMWVKVTVERNGMGWVYERERVLMIPARPASIDMTGQSSDSLYIKLNPEVQNGNFTGRYFGQLFVNDHESDRRAYFRYLDTEAAPGMSCFGSL